MNIKHLYPLSIICVLLLTTVLITTLASGATWEGDPSCARPFNESELSGQERAALEAFSVGSAFLNSYIDRTSRLRTVLDQAIERYDKAIRLKPDFAPAYFNKGVCLIRKYRGWGELAERRSNLRSTEAAYDKVLELRPSCSDALFAKGQAQYLIGAKGLIKTSMESEWRPAADRALRTLNTVVTRFPGTVATKNARELIKEIRYHFDTSIRNPSPPPTQVPVSIDSNYVNKIENVAKKAITKIKTGIITEEVAKISNYGGGGYLDSGEIKNTHGLTLHRYDLQIGVADIQRDYTFRSFLFSFDYEGKKIKNTRYSLPPSEVISQLGSRGGLKETLLEHENIRVTVIFLDAESGSPSTNYQSLTMKVITEAIE